MEGSGATLLLVALGIPIALLIFYLRRPYDSRVPRDGLAARGKAHSTRILGFLPNKAFDDKIRDEADDCPPQAPRDLDGNRRAPRPR